MVGDGGAARPAGPGRQLGNFQCPQMRRINRPATTGARGRRCGALHGGPADARNGLDGVIRGRRVKTTISDRAAPCPLDRVNRQFRAPRPNVLWVSDFTYVATWAGFVYV